MEGNGSKPEKKCPFMIECAECRLSIEMMNYATQQKFFMCSLVATATMLSEINQKTQAPQQKLNIPNLYRG